jgi:hypothetical protein
VIDAAWANRTARAVLDSVKARAGRACRACVATGLLWLCLLLLQTCQWLL